MGLKFFSPGPIFYLPGKLHGSSGRSANSYDWRLRGPAALSKNNKFFSKYFLQPKLFFAVSLNNGGSRNLHHHMYTSGLDLFFSIKNLSKNHLQIWYTLKIIGKKCGEGWSSRSLKIFENFLRLTIDDWRLGIYDWEVFLVGLFTKFLIWCHKI